MDEYFSRGAVRKLASQARKNFERQQDLLPSWC
jgi:hypothetical protein